MANVISAIDKLTKIIDLLDKDWNKEVDYDSVAKKFNNWKRKYSEDYYVKNAKYLYIVYNAILNKEVTEEELHFARQISYYYQFKVPFYVYKHTVPNGKIYIGITCQNPPSNRWVYGTGYSDNELFYNDIIKYGWDNIAHEILYKNLEEYEARVIERKLIEEYKSYDQDFGYNQDKGGRKPVKPKLWEYDRYHQWHKSRNIFKLVVTKGDLDKLINSKIYTMDIFYCEELTNEFGVELYLVKGYPHDTRKSCFEIDE